MMPNIHSSTKHAWFLYTHEPWRSYINTCTKALSLSLPLNTSYIYIPVLHINKTIHILTNLENQYENIISNPRTASLRSCLQKVATGPCPSCCYCTAEWQKGGPKRCDPKLKKIQFHLRSPLLWKLWRFLWKWLRKSGPGRVFSLKLGIYKFDVQIWSNLKVPVSRGKKSQKHCCFVWWKKTLKNSNDDVMTGSIMAR